MASVVDVYPYRRQKGSGIELLILKRAGGVIYAHQWRMVGGKTEVGEKSYEAALRELKEETGLKPDLFWTIPSVNQFYDHRSDSVRQIPAFAAEIRGEPEIELNHEHIDFKWIQPPEIEKHIHWPEQRRLMRLMSSILSNDEILEEWIIQ